MKIRLPLHVLLKYDNYATTQSRIESFKTWPIALKQNGESMAKAGFFYTNQSDVVICYVCGVIIKNWQENDDPITEHVKFKKNCRFVKYKCDSLIVKNAIKKIKNDKLLIENDSKVCTIMPIGSSIFKNTNTTENAIKNENVPLCSICMDEPIDMVMWPCRHLVCFSCHFKIKYCPLCREEIECSFKVFLN